MKTTRKDCAHILGIKWVKGKPPLTTSNIVNEVFNFCPTCGKKLPSNKPIVRKPIYPKPKKKTGGGK